MVYQYPPVEIPQFAYDRGLYNQPFPLKADPYLDPLETNLTSLQGQLLELTQEVAELKQLVRSLPEALVERLRAEVCEPQPAPSAKPIRTRRQCKKKDCTNVTRSKSGVCASCQQDEDLAKLL
jgi:hypothetical protein